VVLPEVHYPEGQATPLGKQNYMCKIFKPTHKKAKVLEPKHKRFLDVSEILSLALIMIFVIAHIILF
jgi:hypothetical protein